MGQTLTHGIYLPDEGERNCYNGLAANWQLLDGAVGTIAEHTSALSDKAPLVHTHVKADITDFPALANVATSGSYNDLSNIPASFTPASHSHGNLTNDGKIGTTANVPLITGTGGVVQAGSFGNAANTFCEGNDSRLSDARTPVAHTHTKSDVTDLFNSANTWSAEQTITNNFHSVTETNYELGQSYPNGSHLCGLHIKDKNGATVGLLDIADRSYGNMEMRIRVQQKFDPNSNNRSTSGDILFNEMVIGITSTKTKYVGLAADLWGGNTYNLGTSTNKWKTLNGINPGALSLPDYTLAKVDLIDFSQWSVAGQRNEYTPVSDGWLFVNIKDTASNSVFIYAHGLYNADPTKATDYSASCFGNGSQGTSGRVAVMIPVRAGITYGIFIKAASVSEIYSAKFYPALGNV